MQPVVILLIAGSAMFIMIGGLSLLSHYYTLNGIKSRTVGDGQYGTARFATQKEIAETYESIPYEPERWRKGEHLPTAQGMILGSMEKAGKLYALVDTGDVHCLMIGAAGVGKTAHFLYPNIEYDEEINILENVPAFTFSGWDGNIAKHEIDLELDKIEILMCTSGTTGEPKASRN